MIIPLLPVVFLPRDSGRLNLKKDVLLGNSLIMFRRKKKKYGGWGDAYTNRLYKKFSRRKSPSNWRDSLRSLW